MDQILSIKKFDNSRVTSILIPTSCKKFLLYLQKEVMPENNKTKTDVEWHSVWCPVWNDWDVSFPVHFGELEGPYLDLIRLG
jgi:hypothetical protein